MSSAAAASPVTSFAARWARGQCSRKSRSRSATDPRWAPLIQARSDTRRLYDGRLPRGPYACRTSCGPAIVWIVVKRFLLIGVLAVAALLPAAAPGAGCSPLSCAASGASIGRGLLAARPSGFNGAAQIVDLETGAVKWRLPSGILVGHTLVE